MTGNSITFFTVYREPHHVRGTAEVIKDLYLWQHNKFCTAIISSKRQPIRELVGVLPVKGVLPELAVPLQQRGAVPLLHAVADRVEFGCKSEGSEGSIIPVFRIHNRSGSTDP